MFSRLVENRINHKKFFSNPLASDLVSDPSFLASVDTELARKSPDVSLPKNNKDDSADKPKKASEVAGDLLFGKLIRVARDNIDVKVFKDLFQGEDAGRYRESVKSNICRMFSLKTLMDR
eukprot:UN10460